VALHWCHSFRHSSIRNPTSALLSQMGKLPLSPWLIAGSFGRCLSMVFLGPQLYCPGPYLLLLSPVTPLYIFIPHTALAYSFSSPTPPLPMHLHWPHSFSRFALILSLSFESRLVIVSGLWRVELGWPASSDPFTVSVVIPLVGMEKVLLR